MPAQLPQPLSVRVYAELPDGSWHLCHVERTHLYGDEQRQEPYTRFGPLTFLRCVRALRTACLRRNFAVPAMSVFSRPVRSKEYCARAPRRTMAAPATIQVTLPMSKLPGAVTLITHNLNFEGAPLFLLEYAAHLASQGVTLSVITAGRKAVAPEIRGARRQHEARGSLAVAPGSEHTRSPIRAADLGHAGGSRRHRPCGRQYTLGLLGRASRAPRRASRRCYIHESTTPDSFYFGYMSPATLPVVKQAFALASQVSFLTEATRRYYLPLLTRANHSLNPGWIDLARIDRYRAENSRGQLRTRLGVPAATMLVVNIGSVCNRKGQHIFAPPSTCSGVGRLNSPPAVNS